MVDKTTSAKVVFDGRTPSHLIVAPFSAPFRIRRMLYATSSYIKAVRVYLLNCGLKKNSKTITMSVPTKWVCWKGEAMGMNRFLTPLIKGDNLVCKAFGTLNFFVGKPCREQQSVGIVLFLAHAETKHFFVPSALPQRRKLTGHYFMSKKSEV